MLLYLQFLVFGLCGLLFGGGVYGLFVLCKLRPQRRLFFFALAGQCFDMRLNVAAAEVLSAMFFVP